MVDETKAAWFPLTEDTEIACVWHAEDRHHRVGNIHAMLIRNPPEYPGAVHQWVCKVRSRQYRGALAFGSKDLRSGWVLPIPVEEPLATTIANLDSIMRELALVFGPGHYFERLDVHGDVHALMAAIKNKPWAQVKTEPMP